MVGIGGQDVAGKLVTVRAELPADVDGILDAVRKILLLGEVQSLTLKEGEPITYQRFVRNGDELLPQESTQSFAELSAYDVVRNVPMEEWTPPGKKSATPHEEIISMYLELALYDWVVTHILMGEQTLFWDWIGESGRTERFINQFLGAKIEKCKEIPADVFILCGAKSRGATVAEIGISLKGTIDEKRTSADDS